MAKANQPETSLLKNSEKTELKQKYNKFRHLLLIGFLFGAAINILSLSVPLYSLQVLGRAIPAANENTLLMLTIVVVIALSTMTLLETVRTRLFNRAGNMLEVAYRRLLGHEAVDAAVRGRPDLSAVSDLTEVKSFVSRPAFAAMTDLPWMPLYVIGISLIHPALGFLMIGGGVLIVTLGLISDSVTNRFNEDSRSAGTRAGKLVDVLNTRTETLRSLHLHGAAVDRWTDETLTATAHAGQATERGHDISAMIKWVRYVLQIAVTGVGAYLVMEGNLSMGGMIATSMLVGRGMQPVDMLASGLSGTLKALKSWKRLTLHIERLSKAEPKAIAPAARGRVAIQNILYVSPLDQKPILRNVSFDLEPGEVLCAFGPNRAGKSVLGRVLAGALRPHAGAARLDNLDLWSWRAEDPLAGIGYMPQTVEILPGTIADNIGRFQPDALSAVEEACRKVGLHDMIVAMPKKYDTDMADVASLFTGGNERLFALARAIVGEPSLLILDEPLAGLDVGGCETVRKVIGIEKGRGTTIIILSHQSTFLELADKALVLTDGSVSAFGPRDEVLAPMMRRQPRAVAAQA